MYNSELIKLVLSSVAGIKVIVFNEKLVIEHDIEKWDMITTLADRLGFVCNRWMSNQQPRTTIFLT